MRTHQIITQLVITVTRNIKIVDTASIMLQKFVGAD